MCPRLHGKGYGGRTDAFWCWLTTTTELAAESMRFSSRRARTEKLPLQEAVIEHEANMTQYSRKNK